jgi:hypothetical protein
MPIFVIWPRGFRFALAESTIATRVGSHSATVVDTGSGRSPLPRL